MTTRPSSTTPATTFNPAALRAELEATRVAFHTLLDSLSDADLARPSSETAWTIKEELWHVAYAVGFMRAGIARAARGQTRGLLPVPVPVGVRDWVSLRLVRWQARRARRADLARYYDRQHNALLGTLAAFRPTDWTRRAQLLGEAPRPIEALAHRPVTHFSEHAASIRQTVKRKA